MSTVAANRQSLTPGAEVVMYTLDLNPLGVAEVLHFSPDYGVRFKGVDYTQSPVQITGLQKTISGETVAPALSLPNTTKFSSGLVLQHDDLVGAEVTRQTTYEKYLDGRPSADPEAIEEFDIFVIEQKKNINKIFAEFELRVLGDTSDRVLPGGAANKNICDWVYRTWDPVTQKFIISKRKPCPYRNTQYMFTRDNVPTTDPAKDRCDNFVGGGCKARAPGWPNGYWGARAFPGMNRYRVS